MATIAENLQSLRETKNRLRGALEEGNQDLTGVPFVEYANYIPQNKLPQVVDGSITELTAKDLAGVASIRNYAFNGCSKLQSVEIANTVTSIGSNAFEGCSVLKNLNLGSGVTYIGVSAFRQCKALAEVNLPNGLTTMGGYALFGTAIRTIRIPSSLYSISGLAFSYCTYLNEVVIEEGVGSISDRAFEFCTSLKELTLPSTIVSIHNNSFNSSALTKLTVKALNPPTLNGTFIKVPSSLVIYVPAQSLNAYKTATNWSAYADVMVALEE